MFTDFRSFWPFGSPKVFFLRLKEAGEKDGERCILDMRLMQKEEVL